MSARRQASATSLSKYTRTTPVPKSRSIDFCNSFWGLGDGGVDVLFARMRGAARTMEELKNFWKERASLEEDYSKRLAKLAKMTLGRDEIGELRNSIDTIRMETEHQAAFHHTLSQQIRSELEAPTTAFSADQHQHKKTYQSYIEKEFKTKQTQESYVNKAREKYEQDCVRINSFTAQASLVQGKDLEKINLKLERTQQTVQTNEREFANFAKALAETVQKWEQDWKGFCDSCQDLEESRMEFMKDHLWAYANAISTVCVSDDESCEKIRVALEQMELEREMEGFVRDYGTGNLIPDPPAFVNYQAPDAIPSASARPTTRPAQFTRSTTREIPVRQNSIPVDDEPVINTAGVGAGGGNSQPALQRKLTASAQSAQLQRVLQDPHASQPGSSVRNSLSSPTKHNGITVDPLMKHLEELQNTVSTTGSSRRNTLSGVPPSPTAAFMVPKPSISPSGSEIVSGVIADYQQSLPGEHKSKGRDQSNSRAHTPNPSLSQNNQGLDLTRPSSQLGHAGIGAHGSGQGVVRAPSPNVIGIALDPSGGLVQGSQGQNLTRPSSQLGIGARVSGQGVLRAPSPNAVSVALDPSGSLAQNQGQNLTRPSSQLGHAGIGAHGSGQGVVRAPSPNTVGITLDPSGSLAQNQGQNLIRPSSQLGYAVIGAHGSGQGVVRAPSPNTVGIALDPSGRVLHDEMAHRYQQQQQQQQHIPQQPQRQTLPPQTQHPAYNPPPPPAQQQQQQQQQPQQQRRVSYVSAPPPPPQQQQQPRYQQQQQPPPQQFQPQVGYNNVNIQRNPSMAHYNGPPPPQQQVQQVQRYQHQPQQHQPQQHQPQQPQYGYHDPATQRSPSPVPPPQAMEEAKILFYVKALYDYSATIEEEFDFQAGDIIAVTATPDDGWWSGELLDENRRQKGRNVFPSNFVCLF